MNIFDVRTFNADEQARIKNVVEDTIECLNQIDDLNTHMNEVIKDACDNLNEGVDKEMRVKPTLIKKLAKTKIKEDLDNQKSAVNELEDALKVIFHE